MNLEIFYKFSGIVILLVALLFIISQIGISKLFNYPQILREDVESIFSKYRSGGSKLRVFWFIFVLGVLGIIPTSALIYKVLYIEQNNYLIIGAFFGIAASIFYVIGLMRWVFLADVLSKKYFENDQDASSRKVIKMIFECFNVYCGNSIGETIGFICTGIWLIVNGIAIISSTIIPPIIGGMYIAAGIFIMSGPLEWVGFKFANKINKIGMKLMAISLICTSISLLILN